MALDQYLMCVDAEEVCTAVQDDGKKVTMFYIVYRDAFEHAIADGTIIAEWAG